MTEPFVIPGTFCHSRHLLSFPPQSENPMVLRVAFYGFPIEWGMTFTCDTLHRGGGHCTSGVVCQVAPSEGDTSTAGV